MDVPPMQGGEDMEGRFPEASPRAKTPSTNIQAPVNYQISILKL
jgi:hypothetical protein